MTPLTPHLYMVVPVFNEVENLERLFGSFRVVAQDYGDRFAVQFLLVDDGSTDGTAERARALSTGLQLEVLSHATNQGPGKAFATAFSFLAPALQDQDWVVTLEGDNTSRHELLRKMFQRASEGYEVVLASPYMYGGGITNTAPLRVFVSHMANAFVKEFLGIHGIMTVSSFFRLYRASTIRNLQRHYGPGLIERAGFECMVELLLKMIYLRTTISEIPMLLDTNLRAGKTKMKIVRTIRGYIALSWRIQRWKAAASAGFAPLERSEGLQAP